VSDERCQLCGTDDEFRTRLWWRGCLACDDPGAHVVCGPCIDEWGLVLGGPRSASGRLCHATCPDEATVAAELMGGRP